MYRNSFTPFLRYPYSNDKIPPLTGIYPTRKVTFSPLVVGLLGKNTLSGICLDGPTIDT